MSDPLPPSAETSHPSRVRSALRTTGVTVALTILFAGLALGYARYRFGSVSASLAYLRSEQLLIDQANKATTGEAGGQVQISYDLTNWTDHPVRLLGSSTSCTCTILDGLPMTLAASETKAVVATIVLDKAETRLAGSILVFTDDRRTPEIRLAYTVRVEPSRPSQPSEAAPRNDRVGR